MSELREALLVVVRKLDFGAHYSTDEFNKAFDVLRASFSPDEISSGNLINTEPQAGDLRERVLQILIAARGSRRIYDKNVHDVADEIMAVVPTEPHAGDVGELETISAAMKMHPDYFKMVFPNGVSKDRKMSVGKHSAFNYIVMRKAIARAERLDPHLADMLMWAVWHQCLDHQRSELLAETIFEGQREIEELRTALARSGAGWRSDMENAPRDGTEVLLIINGEVVEPHRYSADEHEPGWVNQHEDWWPVSAPTHWMPLPAPPASNSEGS